MVLDYGAGPGLEQGTAAFDLDGTLFKYQIYQEEYINLSLGKKPVVSSGRINPL